MRYYFRYKDTILAELSLLNNDLFTIDKLYTKPNIITYMLQSNESFNKWVYERKGIYRPFAEEIFKLGGVTNNKSFVDVSLCLSLKDCFWLCNKISISWDSISLFSNSFSKSYMHIASGEEGFRGTIVRTPSPEFSALGSSCKFFKRQSDGIYLYKSFGWINELEYSGVFSEYFASQLCKYLKLDNYVDYDIVSYDNRLFSKSKLFTSESSNMIDIEDLVDDSIHLDDHITHYKGLALKHFCDMMIVDALMLNVDRHCENIAMMYNNDLVIEKLAPIYDFDHSLCYDLPLVDRDEAYILENLRKYVPKTWAGHTFAEQVRFCCYPEMYKKLLSLSNFRFKNHPRYKLDKKRLKMLNNIFQINYKQIMGVLRNGV